MFFLQKSQKSSVSEKTPQTEACSKKGLNLSYDCLDGEKTKNDQVDRKPSQEPIQAAQGQETKQDNDVPNVNKSNSHSDTHKFDDALLVSVPNSYHHVPVEHVLIKTGRRSTDRKEVDIHHIHHEPSQANIHIAADQSHRLASGADSALYLPSHRKSDEDLLHSQLYPQNRLHDDDSENDLCSGDNNIHEVASFDLDVSVLGSTGSSTLDRAARHLLEYRRENEASNHENDEDLLWPESFLRSELLMCEPELRNEAAFKSKNNTCRFSNPDERGKEETKHGKDSNLNDSEISGQVFTHIGSKMFREQKNRAKSFSMGSQAHIRKTSECDEPPKKAYDRTRPSSPAMLILLASVILYKYQRNQSTDLSFQKTMTDAVSCSNEKCNGNGACAHHLDVWQSFSGMGIPGFDKVIKFPINDEYNHSDKHRASCFCFDDFRGDMCDQGSSVKISHPYLHDEWITNDFYGGMDFSSDDPICGVHAVLNESMQFRQMFKFATCEIDMKLRTSYEHKTYESWWGEIPFDFICDNGVLTGLSSLRDVKDDQEDFLWVATCTHFDKTKIDLDTCDAHGNHLNVTCGDGKVITGIKPTRNGGFKSTLLHALVEDVAAGSSEITIRGSVTYASQSPFILNATLRENILFGLEYKKDLYDRVLEACNLLPDLKQLGPSKDLTEIGERGVRLSGGQKTLISLARCVYSQPSVALFDDILSALDASTGKWIFERLFESSNATNGSNLLSRSAVVLVTHASYFLSRVDKILVLVKGESEFIGNWDGLLAAQPEDEGAREVISSICSSVQEKDEDTSDDEKDPKKGAKPAPGTKGTGEQKDAEHGILMTEEERDFGLSDWSTWWLTWFKFAGGFLFISVTVVSLSIDRGFYVINEWWLASWTSAAYRPIERFGIMFAAQSDGLVHQSFCHHPGHFVRRYHCSFPHYHSRWS